MVGERDPPDDRDAQVLWASGTARVAAMEMVILGAAWLGLEVRVVIVALNDVHHPNQNDPMDGSAAGTTDVKFLGFIAHGQPDVELLERLPAAHLCGLDELHRFTGAG